MNLNTWAAYYAAKDEWQRVTGWTAPWANAEAEAKAFAEWQRTQAEQA